MEKIREFILLSEESKELREELAEGLTKGAFRSIAMDEAADFIKKMQKHADESGVLSVNKDDGNYRLHVTYEKFLEVTKEEDRFISSIYDGSLSVSTHFEAAVDGIIIVGIDTQ